MAAIDADQRDELESIIHELEEENRYYFVKKIEIIIF